MWHACLHLPLPYVSVSVVIRDIFAAHYLRDAPVIPNAIDCDVFKPLALSSSSAALTSAKRSRRTTRGNSSGGAGGLEVALGPEKWKPLSDKSLKRVLLVGNPGLKLKNFKAALDALNVAQRTLEQQGHPGISVTWICQVRPAVTGVTFPVSFAVNPPQDQLPALYAGGHDVFLFTSVYEAWGMPVLEAMAAGVPVVCSRCHGVDTFAFHEHNALLAGPYDHRGLGAAVVRVLSSPELASRLAIAGRTTAEQLTWGNSMGALETALYQVNHFFGLHAQAGRSCSKLQAAVDKANAAVPRGSDGVVSLPSASAMRAAYAKRMSARLHLVHALQRGVVDVAHPSGMFRWGEGALKKAPLADKTLENGIVAGGICVHPPLLAAQGASASSASAAPPIEWGSTPIEPEVAAMADGICIRSVAVPTGSRRGPRVLPPDSPLALAVPKAKLYAASVAIAEAHARQGGGETDWEPPPHVRAVLMESGTATPSPAEAMAQLVAVRPLSCFNLSSIAAAGTLAAQRLDVAGAAGNAHVDTPESAESAHGSFALLTAALQSALQRSPRLVQLYALAKQAQLQAEGGARGGEGGSGGHTAPLFRLPGVAAAHRGAQGGPQNQFGGATPPLHLAVSAVPGTNYTAQHQPAEHTPPHSTLAGGYGGGHSQAAQQYFQSPPRAGSAAPQHTASAFQQGGHGILSTPPSAPHSDLLRRLEAAAQVSPSNVIASPGGHFGPGSAGQQAASYQQQMQMHYQLAQQQQQQQQSVLNPLAPPQVGGASQMLTQQYPSVAHETLRALFAQELNTEQLLQHLSASSVMHSGVGGHVHFNPQQQNPNAPRIDGYVQGQPYTNSFTRNALTGALHPVAVLLPADPNAMPPSLVQPKGHPHFVHSGSSGGGFSAPFSAPLPSHTAALMGAPAVSSYGGGGAASATTATASMPGEAAVPPLKGALRGDAALWRTLPDGTSDGLAAWSGHNTFRGTQAPSPHQAMGREIGVHGEFADSQLRTLDFTDWSSEIGRGSVASNASMG